jgi:transcriptional regulator with XRE-family HTH domain
MFCNTDLSHSVWLWPPINSIVCVGKETLDNLIAFADRVRRLRETAGLTIEQASSQGELSPGFWGDVERCKKEPGLNSIMSIAKGLGVSASNLLLLDEQRQAESRRQVIALLDLCSSAKLDLIHNIAKVVFEHKPENPL